MSVMSIGAEGYDLDQSAEQAQQRFIEHHHTAKLLRVGGDILEMVEKALAEAGDGLDRPQTISLRLSDIIDLADARDRADQAAEVVGQARQAIEQASRFEELTARAAKGTANTLFGQAHSQI